MYQNTYNETKEFMRKRHYLTENEAKATLSENLKSIRAEKMISQVTLSALTEGKISQSDISCYENKKVLPSIYTLNLLAAGLNVSRNSLLPPRLAVYCKRQTGPRKRKKKENLFVKALRLLGVIK